MKTIFLIMVFLIYVIAAEGQISVTADSMVVCNFNQSQDRFIPVTKTAESLLMEIDKDLMTLRVFGKGHEHAVIEKAYIVDMLEVNTDFTKWIFQGEDKNCISYTITLDADNKKIDFITFGKEPVGDKPLTMIYYPITEININKEAIRKHLEEKGSNKY
jgi:hypothetical protein